MLGGTFLCSISEVNGFFRLNKNKWFNAVLQNSSHLRPSLVSINLLFHQLKCTWKADEEQGCFQPYVTKNIKQPHRSI